MRKMTMVTICVGLAGWMLSSAVFADALDDAIRNPNSWVYSPPRSWGSAADGTLSGDAAFKISNAADAYMRSGDWEAALQKQFEYMNATRNSEIDVNKARGYVTASMLCWNTGRKEQAKDLLSRAISLMRNGQNLGGGCEARAVAFLNKMKAGRLPSCFTNADLQSAGGVQNYVMKMPDARYTAMIERSNARYDAMIAAADSMIKSYELQGNLDAARAKAYSRQEYQKSTGRSFSPDNPPSWGTREREHWDACKRVYDIFGD